MPTIFATLVLVYPNAMINSVSLNILSYLIPKDFIVWEELNVDSTLESLLKYKVDLKAKSFELHNDDLMIEAKKIELEFEMDLVSLAFKPKKIIGLVKAELATKEEESNTGPIKFIPTPKLVRFATDLMSSHLNVSFDLVLNGAQSFFGKISRNISQDEYMLVKAEGLGPDNKNLFIFDIVENNLDSFEMSLSSEQFKLGVNALLTFSSCNAVLDLKAKTNFGTGKFAARVDHMNQSGLGKMNYSLYLTDSPIKIEQAETNFKYDISDFQFNLAAESKIKPALLLKENQDIFERYFPDDLKILIATNTQVESTAQGFAVNLSNILSVSHPENGLLNLDGEIEHKVDFSQEAFTQDIKSNLHVEIVNLKSIFDELKDTDFAIPAPINQFNGPLLCQLENISGNGINSNEDLLSLNCSSKLNSEAQVLALNVDLNLAPNLNSKSRPHLNADVKLNEALIHLPKLVVTEPFPNLVADQRIINRNTSNGQKLNQSQKLPFTYAVSLASGAGKVHFQSNLFSEPIPIAFDMKFSDTERPEGNIFINNHKLEFFRRKANIKTFKVMLAKNTESPELAGDISFDSGTYDISMHIFGDIKKPQYFFESKPYLPQEDIMSILLFGKKQADLSGMNMETVDSAQKAIADRAINLFSMYLLASTPVQSINYNPSDGVLSAQLNIADGTSVSLGKNTNDKKVAKFQQILGENWIFETSLAREGDNNDRASGIIKWVIRY